ncbi:methyl-accepting chemotaxis protein [Mesobacterium pallidum]|uniref:methyl-accepting chemotaxis protein n=1 Tax=Mesobacterium pallidum TaxID=2872037 RepID=UPI001EE314A6|nr:methyl-accepting chemotaxis protein [Mesobacterium pallidum]
MMKPEMEFDVPASVPDDDGSGLMNRLAATASSLGYEIVEIAGLFDSINARAARQTDVISILQTAADRIAGANAGVRGAIADVTHATEQTRESMRRSLTMVRESGQRSSAVAAWVTDLHANTDAVSQLVEAVKVNNNQIAEIAIQVQVLAVNAKIEAIRAGEAGRGFSVVANAINELSQSTAHAAETINANVRSLTGWVEGLRNGAENAAGDAGAVLEQAGRIDGALHEIEAQVDESHVKALSIQRLGAEVEEAAGALRNPLDEIGEQARETGLQIRDMTARVQELIDSSETMVQDSVALGGASDDQPFIDCVQAVAARVGALFEEALEARRLSERDLFDTRYREIPGVRPRQFRTAYLDFADSVLPKVQEPILRFDDRVVFCACVDVNGYLPTHNLKFSHPPGEDEVWNTAHCRNRRIFDDRVGLKAGRSKAPFLMQVYRRDMGGGAFRMMKDLSAPIWVRDRHWGGVRLAYSF